MSPLRIAKPLQAALWLPRGIRVSVSQPAAGTVTLRTAPPLHLLELIVERGAGALAGARADGTK